MEPWKVCPVMENDHPTHFQEVRMAVCPNPRRVRLSQDLHCKGKWRKEFILFTVRNKEGCELSEVI